MTRRARLAIRALYAPVIALAVSLPLAGGLTGIVPAGASASGCVAVTGVPPPNPGGPDGNGLDGVAALSSCNAWAVGGYSDGTASQTLVEHWNGSSWKVVSSPNPGGPARDNFLAGVSATSSASAWVVGTYAIGNAVRTLVLRCDRRRCKVVASPNPAGRSGDNVLTGVSAASPASAWAVGWYSNKGSQHTLVLRWNGTAWKHARSPNVPLDDNELEGVSAVSGSDAWAVGTFNNGDTGKTLIEHWNGSSWRLVLSPNPGGIPIPNFLTGVSAVSSASAWAVGGHVSPRTDAVLTLVLRWNGKAWKVVPSPNPGGPSHDNLLAGVSAASPADVWMVGSYFNGVVTGSQTLALHCC